MYPVSADTEFPAHISDSCRYYLDGRTATIDQFYDPEVLNVLQSELETGVSLTRAAHCKAPIWLGETSSAWGGGAEGLSDRYVAGFM